MYIALTILVELTFLAFLIPLLYRLKPRFGLAPLFVFLGSVQLLQTTIVTTFDFPLFGGLSSLQAPIFCLAPVFFPFS